MKILRCPLNGPRNISEFVWGGEVKTMPNPKTASDREWGEFLFLEDNPAGVIREWWCHVPTSFWFIGERDTVTDEVIRTYPAGELFRGPREFPPVPSRPAPAPVHPDDGHIPATGASQKVPQS